MSMQYCHVTHETTDLDRENPFCLNNLDCDGCDDSRGRKVFDTLREDPILWDENHAFEAAGGWEQENDGENNPATVEEVVDEIIQAEEAFRNSLVREFEEQELDKYA